MLVRYKKSFEKIAMGLLSFMPYEKEVKHLMETMEKYEQDDCWHLFLWKKGEEYIGIVGVAVDGNIATVQHISVIPSHRGEGVALAMLQELSKQYKVVANEITKLFVDKCLTILSEAEGTN
ncbi:GNAT family N-acetyltransferase [Ureibacillus acetophenoni]|uniref:Riboflavin biosynthesis RibT protein n=1 Tax=Ureibacillus acetophenoni TaxID=614649 RepID=A0A285U8I1_9BACL|nr:GNAT family N-acetyltransferase [Ureibacillus acetophenoni]SOC38139.1 riboflavin biosynthesis RibT protein [Ureibacillus acetophenoni]